MTYNPTSPKKKDTIAAIATPAGEGGVAIVRISGDQSLEIANRIFSGNIPSYQSHTAHYGKITTPDGEMIDQGLALIMHNPKSFTAEDVVELQCHGGSLIAKKVLEAAINAGARAAQPGEFSLRAFLNGKIDLTQAEAIQELISAKSDLALEAAEGQLQGNLSKKITSFQKKLSHIAAIFEAWVDFPEEGLEFASFDQVLNDLKTIYSEMDQLKETFHDGKLLHDGIRLCLIGCPNAGKSSLMNALLDEERAIVTHIPGTTRDLLENEMRLNGVHVKLIDTAGIHETEELIEKEGVKRSFSAMDQAEIILLVVDASTKLCEEELQLMQRVPRGKTILIWNKTDLPHKIPNTSFPIQVNLSAKKQRGLKELHQAIDKMVWSKGPPSREEIVITNMRHYEALSQSILYCKKLIDGLSTNLSPEFLTLDIRESLHYLGNIVGSDVTEEILNAIFSQFCVGK